MTVLDTHVWVWWLSDPERLTDTARSAVEDAASQDKLFVSSISVWEVALLVERKRLKLTVDLERWLSHCEAIPFLHFLPVTNRIAIESVRLPEPLHPDPADRIIIATALSVGAQLVTKDKKILDYPHVKSVW